MEDCTTIEKKLGRSDAYRSLRSEKVISSCVERHGWRSRQGPYYTDAKTGKSREIDLVGSAYWKKSLKSGDLVARVNLFIEVKSNSDFHVVCAGAADHQKHFNSNEHWIGYSQEALNRIESALTKFNMGFEQVKKILQRVENIAFPRNIMRTSSLRISPHPASESYSAFRETNGSTEKDLDNSVLWRAVLALKSAIQSAQADLVDGLLGDLATDLEVARRKNKPFESMLLSVESNACRLNLYVPVVVIQSRIWSADGEVPRELEWVRLVQYSTFGAAEGWVDVVNQRHFDKYIEAVSAHYGSAFKRSRAKRWM